MSKPEEKQKAVELRIQGFSYNEILQFVPVAKSTLSAWLRQVGLSTPQRQRLTARKLAAARRGSEKLRQLRLERVQRTVTEAEAEAGQRLAAGDLLWVIGTVLYWAEGSKPKEWRTSEEVNFTNMDPRMITLVREWLQRCCSVAESDIDYSIYIHEGADVTAAIRYWAIRLGVPRECLRTYKKRHKTTRRKNSGTGYYGTMRMHVRRSTYLNHRISGWVQGLVAFCGVGQG